MNYKSFFLIASLYHIKHLRQKRKITQVRLGTEIEVSQETISAYESGKVEPKIENLIKMADYLNTSTDYLLGRIQDDKPLIDIANELADKQLEELLNNYARLDYSQRKDLIWYSDIVSQKEFWDILNKNSWLVRILEG